MDMAAPIPSVPHTVGEIYRDYTCRRAGLIRALTTDVDEFYSSCDPEKESLCLYGLPNGNWKLALPSEMIPPEMPDPTLGINFARDVTKRREWLSKVAVHSDAWLFYMAYFFAGHLNCTDRNLLFNLINDLPSVYETMVNWKLWEIKYSVDNSGKSMHSTKQSDGKMNNLRSAAVEDGYEGNKEHSQTLCGTCSGLYNSSEFWITCDCCERWFHGRCMKITPAAADQIKCHDCYQKSSRQKTLELRPELP